MRCEFVLFTNMKSHMGPQMRVISAVTELLVPTAHADVGFNAYASMFQL